LRGGELTRGGGQPLHAPRKYLFLLPVVTWGTLWGKDTGDSPSLEPRSHRGLRSPEEKGKEKKKGLPNNNVGVQKGARTRVAPPSHFPDCLAVIRKGRVKVSSSRSTRTWTSFFVRKKKKGVVPMTSFLRRCHFHPD